MIHFDAIKNYFPAHLRDQTVFSKYLLKEYLQLLILDYISSTSYVRKLTFIGGTSIRLIKGIDRFSGKPTAEGIQEKHTFPGTFIRPRIDRTSR